MRISTAQVSDAEDTALLLLPAGASSFAEEKEASEREIPAHTAVSKLTVQSVRASRIRLAALLLALLFAAIVTGWNILHYPRYEYGEGTSVSSAWAMFKHGRLSYYTYNYSQGPLGWFQIGAWTTLVHGEKAFGLYINSARILMLVVTTISTWLLFQTVYHATGKTLAALSAALLFAGSPVGVGLHRQVWVDNLATMWLLLSLYFLVISPGRLDRVLLSAGSFGVALLTQKSFAVFLPGLCWIVWGQSHPVQRHFAGALWGTITVSAASLFAVIAFSRNELLPSEIFSPFQRPHVSLIGAWFFPLPQGRGGNVLDPYGDFNVLWPQWMQRDPVLAIGGVIAVGMSLFLRRQSVFLFQVSALIVSFVLFLMIDPVVFSSDVIPLTALLPLCLVLMADRVLKMLSEKMRVAPDDRTRLGVQVSGGLAVLLLCFVGWAVTANRAKFITDATLPQRRALQWTANHLPQQSVIVTDLYALADLNDPSFTHGHPFTFVNDGWASANDPSVRDELLNNDWHRINFLVTSPAAQHAIAPVCQPLATEAWKNSVVIQVFGTGDDTVEVRQVKNKVLHHELSRTSVLKKA